MKAKKIRTTGPLAAIERQIQQDPGERGIAPLRRLGILEAAARDLLRDSEPVAIITGFFIADAPAPAAENDGPPGALDLALALKTLGREARIITDPHGAAVLAPFADELAILSCPFGDEGEDWCRAFLSEDAPGHLIAIERPGPSHSEASFLAQERKNPPPLDRFRGLTRTEEHGRYFSMAGRDITADHAPLHRLFEDADRAVNTIGIGDGGNEIGMGAFPWELLVDSIRVSGQTEPAARTACRTACRHALVAGVSNWGGSALAAVLLGLSGRGEAIAALLDIERQRDVLEKLAGAGALCGRLNAPGLDVDGLPFSAHAATLNAIRGQAIKLAKRNA